MAIAAIVAILVITIPVILTYTKKNHEEKVKEEATVFTDNDYTGQIPSVEENEQLILRSNNNTLDSYRSMLNGEDLEVLVISNRSGFENITLKVGSLLGHCY